MDCKAFIYKSSNRQADIYAYIWEPNGTPVGILHILHDSGEHALRYDPFAQYMAERGFIVCAADMLGHGRSAGGQFGFFGEKDGYKMLAKDMFKLYNQMRDKYGFVPYTVFGHGLGSLLARYVCSLWGMEFSSAVFSGTFGPSNSAKAYSTLYGLFIKARGDGKKQALSVNKAMTSKYNKHSKRAEQRNRGGQAAAEKITEYPSGKSVPEWLTSDAEQLAEYTADPLCGCGLTMTGFHDFVKLRMLVNSSNWARRMPKNLPVLFASGINDPAGDFGAGVIAASKTLAAARCESVDIAIFEEARHDILFETGRADVYEYIEKWIRSVCEKRT